MSHTPCDRCKTFQRCDRWRLKVVTQNNNIYSIRMSLILYGKKFRNNNKNFFDLRFYFRTFLFYSQHIYHHGKFDSRYRKHFLGSLRSNIPTRLCWVDGENRTNFQYRSWYCNSVKGKSMIEIQNDWTLASVINKKKLHLHEQKHFYVGYLYRAMRARWFHIS